MRILLATDFYPPFIGGAERQVQLLAQNLARRGHAVSVVTVWHDGLAKREVESGVTIHRIKGLATEMRRFYSDPGRRHHPPFADPRLAWRIRRIASRERAEVVHANGWIAYSCAAALLGKRTPLIVSVRDYGYSCAVRTLLRAGTLCEGPELFKCLRCAEGTYGAPKAVVAVAGLFGGRVLLRRKTTAAHSVSRFVQSVVGRDLLAGMGSGPILRTLADVAPPRVSAIPPPEEGDETYLDQLPPVPFILFVGALQPHKGLGPLLSAYRQMKDPPPLVMIGTTWQDTPTEFPASVTVLRDVPNRIVMAAWRRSLFGVAPSIWPDPLPGVVREAMSQGKPVVASDIGGNPDMVEHERTGLLVPPGDVPALRSAMERLAQDATLRERLGRAAQVSAGHYTAVEVVPAFEGLYAEALAATAGRATR
ncbi:glycosyltransferase family 4 protein [soil metagenome]